MNLLTEIVRIERPARREVLQLRLDRRLLERKFRQTRPGGNNYGKCLSDRGLEWEITTLESALADGVGASDHQTVASPDALRFIDKHGKPPEER